MLQNRQKPVYDFDESRQNATLDKSDKSTYNKYFHKKSYIKTTPINIFVQKTISDD